MTRAYDSISALRASAACKHRALARSISTLACAVGLVLASGTAAAAPFTFGTPEQHEVPDAIEALAIGDVNGDRLDDLVTFARGWPDAEHDEVVVRLQTSDGRLASPFAVEVGEVASSLSVKVADFNEDGRNDIAVGMGYGITMLFADGRGGFRPDQYVDGSPAVVMDVVDANGDGHKDILSNGVREISVILGNGRGRFLGRTVMTSEFEGESLAYGDVTGDGRDDIVAISPFVMNVYDGDGEGNFGSPVRYDNPEQETWNDSVAIGDFFGDARKEIAVGRAVNYTDALGTLVWSQTDSGVLLPEWLLPGKPQGNPVASVARDFDGDGRDDLLIAYHSGLGLYLNEGGGLQQQPALFDVQFQWARAGLATGDLDDDGCPDVALGDYVFSILRGQDCIRARTYGDFDGDGIADLLWHNRQTGASSIWMSADHEQETPLTQVTVTTWKIVALGDFDGDGQADVVWHNEVTGAGTIWKSGNSATQQGLTRITDLHWHIVGAGDFNGDGKDDLLWRHAVTGRNAIWKAGNYRDQQPITHVTDVQWRIAGAGDVDGDGMDDIAWRHAVSGRNAIWLGGDYRNQQPITAVSGTDWQIAAIGDFDGDGSDDLFWRHRNGSNTIWRSASYARPLPVPKQPTRWTLGAASDYDGNGKDDLVWRNTVDGSNVIWRSAAPVTRSVATISDQNWGIER